MSVRVGNDNYLKTVANYNTGKMDNGSAFSVLFSRTAGDGYVNGTEFEAYSYFLGYGKESDDGKSNIQFIVTGAPQIHGHRYRSFYNQGLLQQFKDYGIKYNYNHGMLDGESFNMRNNFYHKPIASLNWEFKPNNKTTLSSTLYASVGRGGGTGDIGRLYGYQYFSGDLNYNGKNQVSKQMS